MNCKFCHIEMKTGKAIPPAVVVSDEGTHWIGAYIGQPPMVECWKCEKCGYSKEKSCQEEDSQVKSEL